jgi:hypothetical protein
MTIFTFYVFSKRGESLFYAEFFRPMHSLRDLPGEDAKLMFGLLFSLKQLMNSMSPAAPAALPPQEAAGALPGFGPEQGFFRFATDAYTLFHLEVPTGYRFVATCDAAAGDLRPALWAFYEQLFTAALKNPAYVPGTPIDGAAFAQAADAFFRGLPGFAPTPQMLAGRG